MWKCMGKILVIWKDSTFIALKVTLSSSFILRKPKLGITDSGGYECCHIFKKNYYITLKYW